MIYEKNEEKKVMCVNRQINKSEKLTNLRQIPEATRTIIR